MSTVLHTDEEDALDDEGGRSTLWNTTSQALQALRPGIVHRLDRGTTGAACLSVLSKMPGYTLSDSQRYALDCHVPHLLSMLNMMAEASAGLMVVAKNDVTHAHLCNQFKNRTVCHPSVLVLGTSHQLYIKKSIISSAACFCTA